VGAGVTLYDTTKAAGLLEGPPLTPEEIARLGRRYGRGRTERSPEARLTPEEKAALAAAVTASGLSFADWLMAQVDRSSREGV